MKRARATSALSVAAALVLGGCLQTAVSSDEKLARACGKYVDASEETDLHRVLLQLREARHWAELARDQDRGRWQTTYEALGRLVRDADDPDRAGRDVEAGTSASRLVVSRCLEVVEDGDDRAALEAQPLIVIERTRDN
jgi:hypothetical protein